MPVLTLQPISCVDDMKSSFQLFLPEFMDVTNLEGKHVFREIRWAFDQVRSQADMCLLILVGAHHPLLVWLGVCKPQLLPQAKPPNDGNNTDMLLMWCLCLQGTLQPDCVMPLLCVENTRAHTHIHRCVTLGRIWLLKVKSRHKAAAVSHNWIHSWWWFEVEAAGELCGV